MNYHWKFPHFHKGRFASYHGARTRKTFWRSLGTYARLLFSKKHALGHELNPWTSAEVFNTTAFMVQSQLMWIGHATFLMRIGNTTIITDPIFDTISYIMQFRRVLQPGLAMPTLPPIDLVLISHNHRDHMDERALSFLKQRDNPTILVPEGDKAWFDRRGFERVRECMWWDSHELNGAKCTFVPGVHWSQRNIFDHNRSLWGGWMVEEVLSARRVFFAGDTAYGSHFKAIADVYPQIDVALMPIGPSEPREMSHMNPEEAGQAFIDLGARSLVPMHWGAYNLGIEHPLNPIKRMTQWWQRYAQKLKDKQLLCLKVGQKLALASGGATHPSGLILPTRFGRRNRSQDPLFE